MGVTAEGTTKEFSGLATDQSAKDPSGSTTKGEVMRGKSSWMLVAKRLLCCKPVGAGASSWRSNSWAAAAAAATIAGNESTGRGDEAKGGDLGA